MTNFEKMQLCYTDVLDAMCDLTNSLSQENDLNNFMDDLDLIDKASVILKRMGDTVLIEQIEEKVGGNEE
jgi:hypothetical protein